MTAAEILSELEARQVELRLAGDRLRIRPVSRVPESLLEEIRRHKPELVETLTLRGWPEASRRAVQEFRVPEARLFPFVGKLVWTPDGQGRLVAVAGARAEVAFVDGVAVFLPSEVRPSGVERQDDDPFEAVH
jgi:hypothetical protein